jgi:predicted phosphodiesterase
MREPVRVISDLHLGLRASRIVRVAALEPLWEGAGTVVFNGDTWQELLAPLREKSAAMLEELRHCCGRAGCEAVFLAGNHDPGWPGPGFLELAGGRIVVTHGDALMYESSPWKREILMNCDAIRELWQRHPRAAGDIGARLRLAREIARALPTASPPSGRRLWQRAWDAVTPPRRALRMLEAWWCQGALGAEFCGRYFPRAEVLVVGHFHRHGLWHRGGRLIINTGSFVSPGRAHWVEWNDGWLRRGEIDETPEHCRPGKILGVWRLGR